ncbi:MAG TPA: dihydroorotate dehydrogenase [Clostridia bacterium]|jgi:dihydroorotate dehydrogenase (NAD+) catalytic subunit|nr:dihydroorotate dehydrogenase [Clostridia bacterium]
MINVGGLELKNPVIAASGTFGFGREFSEYYDLGRLGGISVKGLTLEPRMGNKTPRICETPSGILNSVGLQNPGVHEFVRTEIPFLRQYDTKIIANIAGNSFSDYEQMAEILNEADVDAIELNVSCPNVKEGVVFGQEPTLLEKLTRSVKDRFDKPLFVKLTPNVTSIVDTAKAAEAGGADGVSLINTLLGMAIDIYKRRPILANNTGGLSGPCVKPVAVRMVHEVYRNVNIPVIGMGGIETGEDAVEFIIAGASCVMVGTASFVDPLACIKVIDGIEEYMKKANVKDICELVGCLELN